VVKLKWVKDMQEEVYKEIDNLKLVTRQHKVSRALLLRQLIGSYP